MALSGWPLLSGPRIELDAKQQRQIFANVVSFSNQLREADVTLDSVNPLGAEEGVLRANYYQEFLKGVGTPSKVDLGDLALPVLALQSGGLALQGSTDVAGMLRRCFEDLQSWYEISFDPPPADAPETYHHVSLKVDRPASRCELGMVTIPSLRPRRYGRTRKASTRGPRKTGRVPSEANEASQSGDCSSGIGAATNSLRHWAAVQRAARLDFLRRALSVEIPVPAYI